MELEGTFYSLYKFLLSSFLQVKHFDIIRQEFWSVKYSSLRFESSHENCWSRQWVVEDGFRCVLPTSLC